MLAHLRCNLSFAYLPQEEVFTSVYGPRRSLRFWEIECSEPMKLNRFVDLLAVTGTPDEPEYTTSPVTWRGQRREVRKTVLGDALLNAFQAGESWFVGDTTSLRDAKYGHQVAALRDVKVQPRQAAEWLLRMPKRRAFVPKSLGAFLEGSDAVNMSSVAQLATDRTGAPGAPSSMHLVEAEMLRRSLTGEMILTTVNKEAAALAVWLKQAHPTMRPATSKAIENGLRHVYKRLKAGTQK